MRLFVESHATYLRHPMKSLYLDSNCKDILYWVLPHLNSPHDHSRCIPLAFWCHLHSVSSYIFFYHDLPKICCCKSAQITHLSIREKCDNLHVYVVVMVTNCIRTAPKGLRPSWSHPSFSRIAAPLLNAICFGMWNPAMLNISAT